MKWDEYLKNTKGSRPRPLFVEALPYVTDFTRALDIGCGALNDTRAMLDAGFRTIDLMDSNPSIRELAEGFPEYGSRLTFYAQSFEDFSYPQDAYGLVSAQYSLPFTTPERFMQIWSRISDSLVDTGVFTGTFFGPNDDWSDRPGMTFLSSAEVESLFGGNGWKILKFSESENDRKTAAGEPKHWHTFDVIASRVRGT